MTSDTETLVAGLAGYARRLHAAAGDRHHVVSPLGAWLLLALSAPAARGPARAELAEILGCDAGRAARLAAGLLARPHPLVATAAAVWARDGGGWPPEFRAWRAGLPPEVETGELPGQAALDAWARDHTFGLIRRFPGQADPGTMLSLATALATRVSWEMPFELVPAAELGAQSPWARRLGQVLRTPAPRPRRSTAHEQFIAETPEAGLVAVHLARARGGLLVASVAAAAGVPPAAAASTAAVPPSAVLAAAQRIGCASAVGDPVRRRALADLPLGEEPLWRIGEEQAADGGSADVVTAVLPAWSAQTKTVLRDPALGFAAAAAALDPHRPWEATQAAMARYSRTGFEAAAVTGMAAFLSLRRREPGRRRVAELRFAHPYAVVAVACDLSSPWHGIPVFSAWVAEPEEPADEAEDGAG